MSYTKVTSFAIKDTMADSNPLKVLRGKEFDDEFDAITTAMAAQDGVVAALVTTPVGGIIMSGLPGIPVGFLLCDGAAQSRNTYLALFQAIGTAFGAGDGTTTFNVPNLVGRFPYGGPIGQLGGSADSIVPQHSHTASATVSITDTGHVHTIAAIYNGGGGFGGGDLNRDAGIGAPTNSAYTGITAASTVTVASTGISATNANLPPFVGLNFIIKT
jgi:microcystin-dependent protein